MNIDPVFSRNPVEAARLQEKHICIVGLGSGGSALALMAARAGVGHLTLIDHDTLSLENICRHMLSRDAVGQPKVKAVKRAIRLINPAADVHAVAKEFQTLRPWSLFGDRKPDLLIGATDSFACHAAINAFSLEAGVPAVYGGCWGEASVGEILYVVPGKTPCYECYAGFRRDSLPSPVPDPRRYTDPDFDSTRLPGQAGLWPNILMIAAATFQVVLALLLPDAPAGQNLIDYEHTLWLINISAYESQLQPLAVTFGRLSKGCAVCDEAKLAELGSDIVSDPALTEVNCA
jgi:molybdopterin/thiamine biosynthesis adenylyltransferase